MIPDLFGAAPVVSGLVVEEEFIGRAAEQQLIARILELDLTPFRFQGWEGKRLTQSFGWRYDFDNRSFARTHDIPDWLLPLRLRAARVFGLAPEDLVQALVVRYNPGAGIGWHRDRSVFDQVVGVSLESHATLRLRKRIERGGFRRTSVPLAPRSAYVLTGEVRHEWEHSIAPAAQRRLSITFRTLSEEGRLVGGA